MENEKITDIDKAIEFCKEKSKNIKLKTESQTFVYDGEILDKPVVSLW